jgi:antitoxin component YwqK of YwqJK toxin-antitoxin module
MASLLTYIPRITLLSAILLFAGLGHASTGDDLNSIDDQGLRQGYWIIKGYMSEKPEFAANNKVEEGEYLNNKKEGSWKHYWPNGNMKSEIFYHHNRPQGAYKVFYIDGQLEEQGNWERNKNIGEFRRFHTNGQPQQEFYFADSGKRNGIQKYYHDNGQVELEVNIINGKESGVMKRYHPDGMMKQEMVLENGVLKDGSIKNHDIKSNKPSQKPKQPTVEEIYDIAKDAPETKEAEDKTNSACNFKPNGYNILYSENQQVTQIGEFKNGRLWNGKWHRYNRDGILVRIEIYKSSRYIGTGVIEEE